MPGIVKLYNLSFGSEKHPQVESRPFAGSPLSAVASRPLLAHNRGHRLRLQRRFTRDEPTTNFGFLSSVLRANLTRSRCRAAGQKQLLYTISFPEVEPRGNPDPFLMQVQFQSLTPLFSRWAAAECCSSNKSLPLEILRPSGVSGRISERPSTIIRLGAPPMGAK